MPLVPCQLSAPGPGGIPEVLKVISEMLIFFIPNKRFLNQWLIHQRSAFSFFLSLRKKGDFIFWWRKCWVSPCSNQSMDHPVIFVDVGHIGCLPDKLSMSRSFEVCLLRLLDWVIPAVIGRIIPDISQSLTASLHVTRTRITMSHSWTWTNNPFTNQRVAVERRESGKNKHTWHIGCHTWWLHS